MNILNTKLNDCYIIEPDVFTDERGFFLETYNNLKYSSLNIPSNFVQDNHSRSKKNTLRGLHFQIERPQGKLVRVVNGEVFDVVLDLRRESSTYGHWESFLLNAENKKQIWIPGGFAHGFLSLKDNTDFEYKCTDYYDPSDEGCIVWNDPDLSIDWPIKNPLISDKDLKGTYFKDQL